MTHPTNTERGSVTAENFCPDCFRDKAKVATVYRDVCSKGLRYADSGAEADCQRIADRIKAAPLTRAWPSFDAWWATKVRLGSGWTTLERLAAIAAWKHLERQFAAPQPSVSAAEGDGWRPISEAPKDGSTFLIGWFDWRGRWKSTLGYWIGYAGTEEGGRLVSIDVHRANVNSETVVRPYGDATHFHHLPKPLAAQQEGKTP